MRLIDHFDRAVLRHPDRAFVTEGERSVSYRQAQTLSRRIANALADNGVRPGMHVALYSQNSADACLAVLGVLRAGCVWTTFDVTAKPGPIVGALAKLDVEALFFSAAYAAEMEEIRTGAAGLRLVQCLDGKDGDDLESWAGPYSDGFADLPHSPDDLTTLFSSGGTTGLPKGIMATHRCWEVGLHCTLRHTPHEAPVDALIMPVTHAGGGSMLLYGAARGFSFLILGAFEPERFMRTVQEKRVTHVMMPPLALGVLLSHPKLGDYDLSSLRGLLYGSGPTPRHMVIRAFEVFGPVIITGYGQTETTTGVAVLNQADHAAAFESGDLSRLDACGRVLPEFEVEIMGEDGRILPTGEIGEIVIRGESLMTGYYKDPNLTAATRRDGWHCTGDIGRKDADDYLYILDRKRDMIISRGYKIFPAEVEGVLHAHPDIRECAVVGAPDDLLGEIPVAVVAFRPGAAAPVEELARFCRSRLGAQKSPVRFEIWDDLPKSRVGKILRHDIRSRFWEGRGKKV